jgi:M3 family oligoendopeptidase
MTHDMSALPPEVDGSSLAAPAPDLETIRSDYHSLRTAWQAARDAEARYDVFRRWDELRRRLATWQALARLRFDQQTTDPQRKAARDLVDEMSPRLMALDDAMKRLVLDSPGRADLEARIGRHVTALWECELSTFSPEIEEDLTREARLEAEYTALLAGARLAFEGETLNLAGIEPYTQSPDRDTRYRAQQTKWAFFATHGEELDRIFDDLVRVRHAMARRLGFSSFTELAYRRLNRLDYGPAQVERYRQSIARDVVPLAADVIARRAKRLGIRTPMYWDESLAYPGGNPVPSSRGPALVEAGRGVFTAIHEDIGRLYGLLVDRRLLDLASRDGKALGGYCTSFPAYGVPFIFANFNGTHDDVHVLVHEMGHAFADYENAHRPVYDEVTPTLEAAEVHSMSLEYLAWPQYEVFFGADAERYRRQHLEDAILFLPYGAAVDHFQHLVYAQPDATPAQRHEMWRQVERTYLHWRRYGDCAYLTRGGLWQAKMHVYQVPFYYIDYTLALTCALQFWSASLRDYREAVGRYVGLCRRGGEAPFTDLVRGAGLTSPFQDGALRAVGAQARTVLAAAETAA